MNIELHLIQSFAPSNLNRDDTNNPKDSEFGGVRRARISSQCIKRAVREHPAFESATAVPVGVRTRYMSRLLTDGLVKAGKDGEAAANLAEAFAAQYCGMDKKVKGRSGVMIYLSRAEVEIVTKKILENWDQITAGDKGLLESLAKEVFKASQNHTSAPDIALFGRMLAEKPELGLDAACQVAHAISTHRVNMEMDFFTAADDLLKNRDEVIEDLPDDKKTGAAMMGVTGFNSACFYRYTCINWEQLVQNLGGDEDLARGTVEGFLRASVLAVPSGKQNSFAAQNPPDFMLVVVRRDGQAWSLANAFEKPVYAGKNGLTSASIEALDRYWGTLQRVYGNGGPEAVQPAAFCLREEANLVNLGQVLQPGLNDCVRVTLNALAQQGRG